MPRPIEALIREAAAALPPGATCDAIATWILARRAARVRALIAAIARQTLRRWHEPPPWARQPAPAADGDLF